MADDIKVRLSAEGVQDIVAAFNQIRDSAKQAGAEGAAGFTGPFKEGLKELQGNLLGFLGIGEIISHVHELFTEITQGAVSLEKLHQTTGLSTDALQAMNAIAKENLVSQEALDKGLQAMSRTLGQAELGSSKAQQALGTLGISMKDLAGLSADQQFKLIAERLAEIQDPAQRAAAGAAIFNRSFAQIEPVITEVAEKGFGPFLDKLKSLGVYLSGDLIAQMRGVQQGMNEVGEEAKGMATQFLAGFIPDLQAAMTELVKATNTGGSGFASLGNIVGKVVNGILLAVETVGKGIGAVVADAVSGVKALLSADANLLQLQFGKAFKDISDGFSRSRTIWSSFGSDVAASASRLFATPTPPPGTPGNKSTGGGDGEDTDAVSKARLALIEARLQAELALLNAHSKLRLDAEKQSYEEGKLSLEQYYADRQAILQAQFAKEIEILQQRRAAVAAQTIKPGDQAAALRQQAELITLDGQIAAKREEEHAAVMSNITEENAARKKNYQDQVSAEEKLLELEGRKADAQRLQLGLEAQKLAQELQRGGVPQAQIGASVGAYTQQGLGQIDFTETRQDADAAFTDLQTKINAIKAQVANGQLFPIQGEQQMHQAIEAMLPSLQDYAQQMVVLANATRTDQNPLGNPQLITQAGQFKEKIDALRLSTDDYGQAMASLKKTAQDTFTNGLGTLLANVLSGTQSLGQAAKQLGENFAQMILKLETQFLASQFLKWLSSGSSATSGASSSGGLLSSLGSLLGGGAGSVSTTANTTALAANTTAQTAAVTAMAALTTALAANTTAVATSAVSDTADSYAGLAEDAAIFAAGGGQLIGPSHSSGGVMVEAEGGEFIVNKGAVSRPGVRSLLDAINGTPEISTGRGLSGLPKYSSGGAVGGGGTINKLRVLNFIDLDALSQALAENGQFHKTVVNTVIANGNTVRQGISDS